MGEMLTVLTIFILGVGCGIQLGIAVGYCVCTLVHGGSDKLRRYLFGKRVGGEGGGGK